MSHSIVLLMRRLDTVCHIALFLPTVAGAQSVPAVELSEIVTVRV